jgi:ABC-type glycerol-3-phosphate transport system substrate-binding protein
MSASANDEAIRALFAEGEAGIIPNGAWAINGWEQTHPDFKDYRPIAPPLINTDKQLGWYLASPGGSFVRLSSQTKHPEEAWKLFKWFQSKDAARRYVESGNGASIWLELNDPAYMKPIAYEAYKINADNTRVGPYQPNPDMEKVNFTDIKPSEQAVLQGVFAGQITDIDAALQELATARDKMKEQAFADAKAAGAEKVGFEYLALQTQFPDWDPTAGKDYEPQE